MNPPASAQKSPDRADTANAERIILFMESNENAASTEEKTRPAWMEDSLVKDIPEKKMRFLEQLFASGHGKSQKEMMAFLMPMMKKAKQDGLNFTPQEMNAAIAAIRKHSSREELQQIDKILEKSRQNGTH